MNQDRDEQVGGISDHEKFGETSSFGSTSGTAPSAGDAQATPGAPQIYDNPDESATSVRDRAVQVKTQLADKLETGAGRLRQRMTNTRKIDDAIASTKQRVVETSDRVATGMERSADWLRNTNVTSFQEGLERQVRQNPGRTLLIAGAIGYLLGRAFKGKGA
jgi:ElaB/YqjD/DUF883 family membrane-anchored ribosome-binding protein